jgi:DNA invertase Pin-like site-specific DNA recombinase
MRIGYGFQIRHHRHVVDDSLRLHELECDRTFICKTTDPRSRAETLRHALEYLRPGDVFVVVTLDRLGKSIVDIVGTVEKLQNFNVNIFADKEEIVSTNPLAAYFGPVCAMLADLAERLQSNDSIWGSSGRKSRGRGRPAKLPPEDQARARRMLAEGHLPVLEVARQMNVSPATIYRYFPRQKRYAAPRTPPGET